MKNSWSVHVVQRLHCQTRFSLHCGVELRAVQTEIVCDGRSEGIGRGEHAGESEHAPIGARGDGRAEERHQSTHIGPQHALVLEGARVIATHAHQGVHKGGLVVVSGEECKQALALHARTDPPRGECRFFTGFLLGRPEARDPIHMYPRRPPLGNLTETQISTLQWGIGVSSALSVVGSLCMVLYIAVRLVIFFRRSGSRTTRAPMSPRGRALSDSDPGEFARHAAEGITVTLETESQHWLLLWFSELLVLSLALADLGSSLWYLLQLRALGLPCTSLFAFLGFVFEPTSVLLVTFITASTLVLLRKSLVLQTRRQMRNTLLVLWVGGNVVAWVVPVLMGLFFLFQGHLGSDQG